MADEPRRQMSSGDMIRKARQDLKGKKSDPTLPAPIVEVPQRPSDEEKTWRDPVERAMAPVAQQRRRRPTPMPVQQPTERTQSTSQAVALVSGILLALVGIGLALAIALANGG